MISDPSRPRRIGELSAGLKTKQGEHLPNAPKTERMEKTAALAPAELSKTEAPGHEQIASAQHISCAALGRSARRKTALSASV